jgi:hypothetical protein
MNQIVPGKTLMRPFLPSQEELENYLAKNISKSVNCEHPVNGNPCLDCSVCRDQRTSAVRIIKNTLLQTTAYDDKKHLEGAV